jgi:hypothetical protein
VAAGAIPGGTVADAAGALADVADALCARAGTANIAHKQNTQPISGLMSLNFFLIVAPYIHIVQ